MRFFYTSLVDVSLPYGPGVNERTFLTDMLRRFGGDLLALIPKPARGVPPELGAMNVRHFPSGHSVRTMRGWLEANAVGPVLVRRTLGDFRPDLVILRPSSLPVPQAMAAELARERYVVKTAGDVTFGNFYGQSALRRSVRPLNEWLSRRILEGALAVDVVSSEQRESVLRKYPSLAGRVHVIDNGVDLAFFSTQHRRAARERFGLGSDEFVVGYVGNYPMQRGGREVVDTVAALRPRYKIRGMIVGDTGEAEACRAYALGCGVAESVIVWGEADYDDVPELMASMDVGLSILRQVEGGRSEQKVRQYLATGVCVVGTADSNGFLDGKRFGRVVRQGQAAEVAAAVASLVDAGPEGLDAVRGEARDYAERNLSITSRNDRRLELWGAATESHKVSPPAGD